MSPSYYRKPFNFRGVFYANLKPFSKKKYLKNHLLTPSGLKHTIQLYGAFNNRSYHHNLTL